MSHKDPTKDFIPPKVFSSLALMALLAGAASFVNGDVVIGGLLSGLGLVGSGLAEMRRRADHRERSIRDATGAANIRRKQPTLSSAGALGLVFVAMGATAIFTGDIAIGLLLVACAIWIVVALARS